MPLFITKPALQRHYSPIQLIGRLLLIVFSLTVASNVQADWRQIFEDEQYVYFVNDATKVDKPRPRVRVIRSFKQASAQGDLSAKLLYEAECSSNRLRMMSGVLNKGNMADGAVSGMINSQGWMEASTRPVLQILYELLCSSSAADAESQMGKRISPPDINE